MGLYQKATVRNMHPKLTWALRLATSLGDAMGCSVSVTENGDVDPLKKFLHFTFGEPLGKGDYMPIQNMVHTFAKANDCVVHKIRKVHPKLLVLDVFTKTRLSPVHDKNPLRGR